MWSTDVYTTVRKLFGSGKSDYEIARIVGVPRSTVQKWRHRPASYTRNKRPETHWQADDAPAEYCYLLGLYLGDGHIDARGTPILRFTMDGKYPALIDEAVAALESVFRPRTIGRYVRGGGNWVILQIRTHAVVRAFPQHGRGPKHARRVSLADWQLKLAREHPGPLIRG